ncbi:MAG: transglycosylase SLT domain-containing protein [Gammaproteobacteria bacterium]
MLLRLALLAGLLLCVPAVTAAEPDRYAAQRPAFAKVLKAQAAGQHQEAARLVAGLEDYPLYAWYQFLDLRRRLFHYPSDELAAFFVAYEGSYLAARLRREWLEQLARGKRWQGFVDFYRPQKSTELRCQHLEARIRLGLDEGVLADTRAIWLNGDSLPDACDPAFERLYASEVMDDALVWQRIRLAMAAGNARLAGYLARRLEAPAAKARWQLWREAHADPRALLARTDLDDEPDTRALVLHALERRLLAGIGAGERAWADIADRLAFSAAERGAAARAIALRAARKDHPRRLELLDRVPADSVDVDVARYQLREGIKARDFERLARWTAREPPEGLNALRWRYWRARALSERGEQAAAEVLLGALAGERDYYGFLAADRLGVDYHYNFMAVDASAEETAALTARPGIVRSRELYRLDRRFDARREWAHELAGMDTREIEVAASVAAAWGWPDQAIFALGKARSYDDLELRFPLLFADIAREYAARRKLMPARVMAIMRSESAFVAEARSPAGALGLMQLMPATARETARRIGMQAGPTRRLYEPRRNIALGTAYLAEMMKRYGGNFAMAAAAYNAGPHRVRRWRGAGCTEAEVWIDTIPFTETRRYVRRAFFYTALYQWRMGDPVDRLSTRLAPVPGKQSSGPQDCGT